MKIATWNVNHRATRKAIPETIASAIVSVDADVFILTEYVHCDVKEDRIAFYSQLDDAGYTYRRLSPATPKENHILIASRIPIAQGDLIAPDDIHSSVASNFLHVKCIDGGTEIIGIRVPDYSKSLYKEVALDYWSWFGNLTDSISGRSLVITGDFNIDPTMKKYKHRHYLNRLLEAGWSIASPESGASFWANQNNAPHRLDHVFLTPQLSYKTAIYLNQVKDCWTCGESKYKEPDHAILVADVG